MRTKKYLMVFLFASSLIRAQSSDDVLDLLVKKGTITQHDADSLRIAGNAKQEQVSEKRSLFPVQAGRGVQISGFSQVRFQSLQEQGKPDGFDIRRARIDVRGNISKAWEYRLLTDFASSPKLLDAFVSYRPFDFLKIT